jgi:hypothetical protein
VSGEKPYWVTSEKLSTVFVSVPALDTLCSFKVPGDTLPPVVSALTRVLPTGTVVAGGHLMEVLAGLEPQDIDVWCVKTDAGVAYQAACEVTRVAITLPPLAGHYAERVFPHSTVFESETLPNIAIHDFEYDDPEHILDGFDFTVCQIALTGSMFLVGPSTLSDITSRRLAYNRSPVERRTKSFGMRDVERAERYIKKGFKPAPEMVEQVRAAFPMLAYRLQALALVPPPSNPVVVPSSPAEDPMPGIQPPATPR